MHSGLLELRIHILAHALQTLVKLKILSMKCFTRACGRLDPTRHICAWRRVYRL